MQTIRKLKSKPGLWFCDNVDVPTIGNRDVLVAVTHAGICGTDRHIYEWDRWSQSRVKVGITTGHEFVGRIVKLGNDVERLRVGQRVSAEGHIYCGQCRSCRSGNAHICAQVQILGIDRDGCFAQFVSIPEQNIWPVDDRIPNEIAAIFDPLGNAVHTVMEADVSGKTVLITGVGIIGLMAVTVAKAAGAGKILVSDVDPHRLEVARELGADVCYLASDKDWPEQARAATDGHGPEVLLEMSGSPFAIRQGFAALADGGTAALLGIPGDEVSINFANDIIFKGAKVLGINGRRIFKTWFQMETFLLSGRLNLEPIITHVIEMENFEDGFRMMQSGEAIKVVLKIPQKEPIACPTASLTSGAKT
ncbi:MAG TPA: L-threonine 3-dehydrogenase [Pirellulaceae bacterium]|nr:L-threonine 3-dehydrogenase [Pirellulaceae bacterium]HMO93888.1 L-threonine 3-dehydrogenase [Pirellulaceae bacterium]HMP70891.1 L-threonine 3-dehydrogenase [Pirellulaceae bacterium]